MTDGRDWWTEIQGLKQARQYSDLECVLLALLDSIEIQSRTEVVGVTAAGYWELAVLYRKLNRKVDEIALLERFERQQHAPGAMPRRLLGRLAKLTGRDIQLPPKPVFQPRARSHDFMAVVGESHRQEALRSALEACGREVRATLECEPANAYDSNAVAVKIDGKHVGYLERDVAKRFRSFIATVSKPVECSARLTGGTTDKPSIGVVLDFSPIYALRDGQAF
jgi:hypothetical protein